jgi:hypothetical protein
MAVDYIVKRGVGLHGSISSKAKFVPLSFVVKLCKGQASQGTRLGHWNKRQAQVPITQISDEMF